MDSAQTRQRDLLLAEERKLVREREDEGDEFADKEQFVTSAYKAQQESLKEQEEAERAREEAIGAKSQGVTTLYRKMLEEDEQKHIAAIRAVETKEVTANDFDLDDDNQISDRQIAMEANARGGQIALTDDGEVADKRQLLRTGLNVRATPAQTKAQQERQRQRHLQAKNEPSSYRDQQAANIRGSRDRQTRLIEAQIEASQKRAADDEEEDQSARIADAVQTTKSGADVMSARERYLARKKQQTA